MRLFWVTVGWCLRVLYWLMLADTQKVTMQLMTSHLASKSAMYGVLNAALGVTWIQTRFVHCITWTWLPSPHSVCIFLHFFSCEIASHIYGSVFFSFELPLILWCYCTVKYSAWYVCMMLMSSLYWNILLLEPLTVNFCWRSISWHDPIPTTTYTIKYLSD